MSTLLVFALSDEGGADRMFTAMQSLQKQQCITILDAATVIRKPVGKIKVRHANSLVGSGALGGVFWGMLVSLVFFMPWIGITTGTATGALAGKLHDYGLNERFIKEVWATIRPSNSALFLIVSNMVEDRVIEVVSKQKAILLRTNLSAEDEIKLRDAFGGLALGA